MLAVFVFPFKLVWFVFSLCFLRFKEESRIETVYKQTTSIKPEELKNQFYSLTVLAFVICCCVCKWLVALAQCSWRYWLLLAGC